MLKSAAMIAAAALVAITFAAPARAWDVDPASYVTAAESAPSVTFDWPQWRLQQQCGPQAHEATEGRTILAWTSGMYSLEVFAEQIAGPYEQHNSLHHRSATREGLFSFGAAVPRLSEA